MRIVSLVPSLTELLVDLGVKDDLVGRTRFCIHPKETVRTIPKIGGTKKVNIAKVQSLSPDLIIANKEENEQSQIEALSKKYPVWVSDITTQAEALEMIMDIGDLINRLDEAAQLTMKIVKHRMAYNNTREKVENSQITVAYFIWQKPYMVAAKETFINDTILNCGFINIFGSRNRYPEISEIELKIANPHLILLAQQSLSTVK